MQNPGRQVDSYYIKHKSLFNQSKIERDPENVQLIAMLYVVIIGTDAFLESVIKNPLNIKNHRLYRYLTHSQSNQLRSVIDTIIHATGCYSNASEDHKSEDEGVKCAAGLLVAVLQYIVQVCMQSVK